MSEMIVFQKTMLQWMQRLSKLTRHCKTVWHDTSDGYRAEAEGFVFRLERAADGFNFSAYYKPSRFTFSGSGMRHRRFRIAALKLYFAICWQRLLLETFYISDRQLTEGGES